jgi:hypothetical protein
MELVDSVGFWCSDRVEDGVHAGHERHLYIAGDAF